MKTGPRAPAVGVLSLHSSKETKAICNALVALGAHAEWLREENTTIRIRDGEVELDPPVDVVVNRLLLSKADAPLEELCLANRFATLRPTLNHPEHVLTALDKYATAIALVENDIPVPDAVLALDYHQFNEELRSFGEKAVYKTAIGTNGAGTWLVATDEQKTPSVGMKQAFLQEYIETEGDRHRDMRVYVVGNEVIGSMFRYAPPGDWRTNVALGGEVEDAGDALTDEVADLALRATEVLQLDYAGVDVVEGPDGWCVLEVNPTAGFKGLYEATGISPAPYIAKLAIERAGGEVEMARVTELAATLDDSIPACAPLAVTDGADPATVGYIEEVTVIGTSGAETVFAKSDTGAGRTSIDTRLAAAIGAGPVTNSIRIKSGSLKGGRVRPMVDVVVDLGGERHTVQASVEDRSHMEHPVLLGRDVLQYYHVNINTRADGSA
ncbi:RimK family alpha-L-glutamate ligase [Haloarchaeobius sp. TZWSO28]|uniref:RimK family alpha-L-glutamate ligase n=1 Tax=Haloarchaeobius sp. TZWSO28 TaxID=3446119 RepID=UPI003EBD96B5